MMNTLKILSDVDLLNQTITLVVEERKLTTKILWHLKEIEARKLFLTQGYSSLYEYAVQVLGYSESGAFRRISAMRLLKVVPELEAALDSGKLNLSKLTQAQEFFKHEEKEGNGLDLDQKKEILFELEAKSTRECEKYLAGLNPDSIPKERERILTENQIEIRFVASDELLKKFARFKELDSHVAADPNYAELFERLVDLALKKKDHLLRVKAPLQKVRSPSAPNEAVSRNSEGKEAAISKSPRFIPAKIKNYIWSRDEGKCTYRNGESGKVCGSRFQIQIDHRIPVAKGGQSNSENLRLVCRQHNILFAVQHFGENKMKVFLKQ